MLEAISDSLFAAGEAYGCHIFYAACLGALLFLLDSIRAKNELLPPNAKAVPTSFFVGAVPWLTSRTDIVWDEFTRLMITEREKLGSNQPPDTPVPEHVTLAAALPMGSWPFKLGPPVQLFISDPKDIRHILKENFDNYVKGIALDQFREILGTGIFASDGKNWTRQRKVASHMFSQRVMRDDIARMALGNANAVADLIGERCAAARAAGAGPAKMDIQTLMFRYTFDSICAITFGGEMNSVREDIPAMFAFDEAQRLSQERFTEPLWKIWRIFKFGREGELARHVATLRAFTKEVVSKRRAEPSKLRRSYPDMLSRFLTDSEERGEEMSDDYLEDVILNMMIAGRDTTAALLTWSFLELSRHPEYEKKLLEDIAAHLPTSNGGADGAEAKGKGARREGDEDPMYTAVKKMKFVEAFLLEVLRLHPSVPGDGKVALADDVLPGSGVRVRKGWQVNYIMYAAGRSKAIWGPDVDEFRPERFLGPSQPDMFHYPMFNAGPRLCLGRRVALMEAQILLCSVLPRFKVRVIPSQLHNTQYLFNVILFVKGTLDVVVEERGK